MRVLLDVVAPATCAGCGAPGADLCRDCAHRVDVLGPPRCDRCGTPHPRPAAECPACAGLGGFTRARSLVVFAEPSRALTLALKRRGRRPLARAMGGLLAGLARAEGLWTGSEVVTFVPAGRRARTAGFDHVELLAKEAGFALGAPVRRLLRRAKDGPRQADVPLDGRRANVAGRFEARVQVTARVLLVDDVFTTGATAEACAEALLRSGATRVDVLTWARTLRRRPAA